MGVEEEFLLVDPQSCVPRAIASTVLRAGADLDGDLTAELQAEQVETGTSPHTDLDDIADDIVDCRREATTAARRAGAAASAVTTRAGTSSFQSTPTPATSCGCRWVAPSTSRPRASWP